LVGGYTVGAVETQLALIAGLSGLLIFDNSVERPTGRAMDDHWFPPCSDTITPSLPLCWTKTSAPPRDFTIHELSSAIQFLSAAPFLARLAIGVSLNSKSKVPCLRTHQSALAP
jgi:hypothetical protein